MKDRIVLNYNCTYSVQSKRKFIGISYWHTVKVCRTIEVAERVFKALEDNTLCREGLIVAHR